MDNFKAVYKILSELEKQMDSMETDISKFSHDVLKISETRWMKYIEMMYDCGYIKGVEISQTMDGLMFCDYQDMKITLKGLEYLQENSIMKKIYKSAIGVKEIIPNI